MSRINVGGYARCLFLLFLGCWMMQGAGAIEYSKAGYFEVKNAGRKVYNFNVGWRLFKGEYPHAEDPAIDDSSWGLVNCPNGIQYDPTEASGGVNYRGVVWYRKHFKIGNELTNKILKLHFEAVMGKCKVWLNGHQIGEHFGGYLPFTVALNDFLNADGDNVIAVWADNSDDSSYPPGKPQDDLDFVYFGGIYRDVWLVSTNDVYITNPNEVNKVAGGGLFVSMQEITDQKAVIKVEAHVQNDGLRSASLVVGFRLLDPEGREVTSAIQKKTLRVGKSMQVEKILEIRDPMLWTPWSPDLYRLEVRVTNAAGGVIDGVATRVGLRKIEFKGVNGLYLNNRPYPGKLMGGNRHQDYAYVGNALSNNSQWRDAKIMKEGACDIVRAAHYPADPAFMDACDELGLFFIVATPGWQFWNNDDPIFEQRVYDNIRGMVRRDRNHASVILWEPVLNETMNPDEVTIRAHETVHQEYPYQGAFTACDKGVGGEEVYDVVYGHASESYPNETRTIFQREYGSMWADNTPNRMTRSDGEHAQLFQARQYAESSIGIASWEMIYQRSSQFLGGALWHFFDNNTGCHKRPFYGGVVDMFRQPKYAFHLFASQRDISEEVKPMVFLAHELTPFSPNDITVFTNCQAVRLKMYGETIVYSKPADPEFMERQRRHRKWSEREHKGARWVPAKLKAMPHPIVTFEDVFSYATNSKYKPVTADGKGTPQTVEVQGLVDGKVVTEMLRTTPRSGTKIRLVKRDWGRPLLADGSDFILVTAEVIDRNGSVVRRNNDVIKFEVDGEGEIIGDESISANPRRVEWGTAPILIRSTTKAGAIQVKASVQCEGSYTIEGAELDIMSVAPSAESFIFSEIGSEKTTPNRDFIWRP